MKASTTSSSAVNGGPGASADSAKKHNKADLVEERSKRVKGSKLEDQYDDDY